MAYCTNCGTNLKDNANFCHNCGAPVYSSASYNQSQTANYNDTARTVGTAAGTFLGISLLGGMFRRRRYRPFIFGGPFLGHHHHHHHHGHIRRGPGPRGPRGW